MKSDNGQVEQFLVRRTPQGVRGLKLYYIDPADSDFASHPARGAWIEISFTSPRQFRHKSHPARGAWIEIAHQ